MGERARIRRRGENDWSFTGCRRLDILAFRRILKRSFLSDRSSKPVADKFDPYREALVMETETVWPEAFEELPAGEKVRLEAALHADPASCGQLEYVRTHTGFCRQITVTQADVQRLSG
jgi:hypothetical protein